MTSINWWTFSWVSKWKWSQGRFLMNKLHFPQVRLTVIFWHINSFIIKGSAKFRNKAECLLVLSKRFVLSKSINVRRCRPGYLIEAQGVATYQTHSAVSPGVVSSFLVDQIEKYPLNFQGWDSNQIIWGKGAISGTFLLCVNRFGSFTSELQATSTTMCHSLYKSPLKCAYCSIFQAVSSFICQSGLSNISRPVPKFLSQFVYDVLKIQKYLVKFAFNSNKRSQKVSPNSPHM